MPALQNDTLIRALLRQPTPYTPVWLMRQAGRYLPEYNETRRRAGSFLALCKTPSLAAEVTLQPLARFPLDAAILFSDILTIPDAMGLGLYFAEGEGPRFERPLRDEASIAKLYSSEVLGRVIDRAVQIHGGYGVSKEFPIERWYREARIRRIGEGPSEVHRMVIARSILR